MEATAVITTSEWSRRRLGELYGLPANRVHVAEPGVDAAGLAPGTAAGDALLCVGSVTPDKGHDVLLGALKTATDLSWRGACVGSLDRAPAFADRVRRRAWEGRLLDRVGFLGARTGPELDRAYAAADLLVLASHAETYGMVVTEALARGLPVLATDVGGVTEALGQGEDGTRPGLLVPPGDPAALGAALRAWLEDAELRDRLRLAARGRSWPRARSVSFAAGLVVIVLATQSGIARYDRVLFSLHVAQHLLLGMVAPLLLVLGAPITLALQAGRRTTQTRVLRFLHSRPVAIGTGLGELPPPGAAQGLHWLEPWFDRRRSREMTWCLERVRSAWWWQIPPARACS